YNTHCMRDSSICKNIFEDQLMPRIEGPTHSADFEWDKEGKPVLYIHARGHVNAPKDVIDVIGMAVKMTNERAFKYVCGVYDAFEVTHIPFLGRFLTSGRMPSTERTAHIIIGTTNPSLQLIAQLMAVVGNKRLRTAEACKTPEELATAVKRWLALPD